MLFRSGETTADMKSSLRQVLAAEPENITVHTLALKRGSPLLESLPSAELPPPETVRGMVAEAEGMIRAAGLKPYYLYRQKNSPGELENVGYMKPGAACVYNVDIIEERRTLLGMGPSAASKAVRSAGWRLDSCHFPKDIPTYIKRIEELTAKRNALVQALFTES